MPYWPQLRHCMFIRTRTQAYLEKGLGADFDKLPRATAMRTLFEVRESIVWILKLLFEGQLQSCTERIRLSVPLFGCAASHSEFDSVGARNIPERLRFTKAVLQSKDIGCSFAFPCQYGSPSLAPAPGIQPLKKIFQEAIFLQAVKWKSQFVSKGSLLRGRAGSQLALC